MGKYNFPINQDEVANYLKELRQLPVITPEREKELAEIMKNPETTQAQRSLINQELIEGNLRFVITVAKDYQGQGIDLADLISEGNMGLIKAIDNFDWDKGYRFISYAVWWIRQSILQSLNEHSRTIRLPVNVVQDVQRAKKQNIHVEEVNPKLSNLPYSVNFEQSVTDDGDTLLDFIADTETPMADELVDGEDALKNELLKIMDVLDERERIIITEYFGMNGMARTLEDIGSDFNLTKERVRQIKESALRKLRNESYSLFEYM